MAAFGKLLAVAGLSNAPASATRNERAALGTLNNEQRRERAYEIREAAALNQKFKYFPATSTNADEVAFPNGIASFSKGLPHNELGEPDPAAFAAMTKALGSGAAEDFEAISMGGVAKPVNPLGAYAFTLGGLCFSFFSFQGSLGSGEPRFHVSTRWVLFERCNA